LPRKRENTFTCPKCGKKATNPIRTWTLVSPIPDKYGRVTITIMGAFICESCGEKWNSTIQKIKTGGEEKREAETREEPYTITIDLNEI